MLKLPLKEPLSPRYIYINPETNQVHLLVPVVQGQEISTDNTCKSTKALDEFKGAVIKELSAYKAALEYDLQFLEGGSPQTAIKSARLTQINAYINAACEMSEKYSSSIADMKSESASNLYGIQLRPHKPDNQSKVVDPVFNIKRTIDATGTPESALYNAMHEAYPNITILALDAKSRLDAAVLSALPNASVPFATIQAEMTAQCKRLFGLNVNFTETDEGKPVNQAAIEELLGYEPGSAPLTTKDYIDGLWGACAQNIEKDMPISPFYNARDNQKEDETEKLSIVTQFFLGIVNIYCAANNISQRRINFGVILDASPELSFELVAIVSSALITGAPVEESLYTFFNNHAQEFSLTRPLLEADMVAIQQKFERTYATITADPKKNPHMDDFMVLDMNAHAKHFVTYQGSICTDFVKLIDKSLDNEIFQTIRRDFETLPIDITPHKKELISANVELSTEALIARIDDEQFKTLSPEIQAECLKSPAYQLRTFLHDVAKGKQDIAQNLLTDNPKRTEALLLSEGTFTDYSGRTFHCTAYEYAYWAKDTHMCRMLEAHMDSDMKAQILERVEKIERDGLSYHQHGKPFQSPHFDFTLLKDALDNYVKGYDNWEQTSNWDAMKAAWMQVGLAQRDVPAHVAQEYCRRDRSFSPLPSFNEGSLLRGLTFYNGTTDNDGSWFPLLVVAGGLGFDFALGRGGWGRVVGGSRVRGVAAEVDFAAVNRLDEVRTVDLTQSRENLSRPSYSLGMS